MPVFFFFAVFLIEIFALANRGGGPLLSHLSLTAVTFLLLCFTFLFRNKLNFRACFTYVHASYFIFFILFVISLFTSLTPEFGLAELLLFANTGILFFLFSSLIIKEKSLRWFSCGLIALAVIDTLIGYFIYTKTSFPRFAGTFIDLKEPYTSFGNDFANFLLLILPLAIAEFLKKHERITTTIVTGLATAILFSGFLLSFSRAAWVSFLIIAIGAVLWIFLQRNKEVSHKYITKKNALARLAGMLLVVIILVNGLQWTRAQQFAVTPLFKKVIFTADEGGASASERLQFWKGALKLIKDHPWFGSGVLSFKFLHPKYQEKFEVNWDHPHNIFLKIALENGLPAAIFFALFLIFAAYRGVRFLWRHPYHSVIPFFAGALGAFGHNLLDFNFIVANFTLFIVFLGIGISVANAAPNEAAKDKRSTGFFFASIFLISVFLLFLGFHEGYYNIHFKKGRAALAEKRFEEATVRLEKSLNLFFQRDLVHYLAEVYRRQFEKTKDSFWREKEEHLLLAKADTKTDAVLLGKIGEMFFAKKSYSSTEDFFKKALGIDPQNHLKFYYFWLEARKQQQKALDPLVKQKIINILAQYQIALRQNRHFTIRTENPKYASKLYEFFGLKKEKAELDLIWFEELVKFTVKYNLTRSTVPKPHPEGWGKRRRSVSTLSKLRPLGRRVEGLTQ